MDLRVLDDCKVGWHLANYWVQSDGTYTIDKYADGEHDDCDPSDVPTSDEYVAAWAAYYEYVADEGKDPCGEFLLPTQRKKSHRWQARLRKSVGSQQHGLRVTGVRRRGRGPWLPLDGLRWVWDEATDSTIALGQCHIPIEVLDYLLGGHPAYKWGEGNHRDCHCSIGPELATWDALREACGDSLRLRKNSATLDFSVDELPAPWSDERVSEWLRKAARRAIKQRKACTIC